MNTTASDNQGLHSLCGKVHDLRVVCPEEYRLAKAQSFSAQVTTKNREIKALVADIRSRLPEKRDMADMRGLGQIGNEGFNECLSLVLGVLDEVEGKHGNSK